MAGSYRVKRVVLSSGERMDFLVGRDGMPLPDITLYMLCELRTRSLATHTIVNSLRALQLFQIFLDARQINLRERLGKGRILQSFEVEALVQACKLSMPSQAATPGAGDPCMSDTPPLEKFRKSSGKQIRARVKPAISFSRLCSIREFIKWLATDAKGRLGQDDPRARLIQGGD